MSPSVVVNREGARAAVSAERLADAGRAVLRAERVKSGLLSLTLLSAPRMAALNRKHLGHAGATDVISFGFRDPQGAVIGDVYICPAVAARNARRFRVGVREELLRLVVHGKTDSEIGKELFISPRTVQNHLTRIREKTGLRRRSELTRWAVEHAIG